MSRLSEDVSVSAGQSRTPEYSPEERQILLSIAHRSILSAFQNESPPSESYSTHLSEPRGVFTTLYLDGQLRGCVGYALPIAPLHRAVAESARAAAFEDTRFWSVTEDEAPRLEISLSVLSKLVPLKPEEVQVGEHGLVVSHQGQRGLLLPQVPVEYGWDRETFLVQTCRKAGFDPRVLERGATLEGFTAEVFGDRNI